MVQEHYQLHLCPSYLQFVLRPVDNNTGDLLVHKKENGEKERRNRCCKVQVCGKALLGERNQPVTLLVVGWLLVDTKNYI